MDHLKPYNSLRKFLKDSIKLTAGTITLSSFPTIVPFSVFGKFLMGMLKRINYYQDRKGFHMEPIMLLARNNKRRPLKN